MVNGMRQVYSYTPFRGLVGASPMHKSQSVELHYVRTVISINGEAHVSDTDRHDSYTLT